MKRKAFLSIVLVFCMVLTLATSPANANTSPCNTPNLTNPICITMTIMMSLVKPILRYVSLGNMEAAGNVNPDMERYLVIEDSGSNAMPPECNPLWCNDDFGVNYGDVNALNDLNYNGRKSFMGEPLSFAISDTDHYVAVEEACFGSFLTLTESDHYAQFKDTVNRGICCFDMFEDIRDGIDCSEYECGGANILWLIGEVEEYISEENKVYEVYPGMGAGNFTLSVMNESNTEIFSQSFEPEILNNEYLGNMDTLCEGAENSLECIEAKKRTAWMGLLNLLSDNSLQGDDELLRELFFETDILLQCKKVGSFGNIRYEECTEEEIANDEGLPDRNKICKYYKVSEDYDRPSEIQEYVEQMVALHRVNNEELQSFIEKAADEDLTFNITINNRIDGGAFNNYENPFLTGLNEIVLYGTKSEMADSVIISPNMHEFTDVGSEHSLNFTALASLPSGNEDVSNNPLTRWQSSDTLVITIDEGGIATPVSQGVATITATYQGIVAESHVRVTTERALESLVISVDEDMLSEIGQRANLTAMAHYSDDTVEDITDECMWSSSNSEVVTIVDDGTLTQVEAINEGYSVINASFGGLLSNSLGVYVSFETVDPELIITASTNEVTVGDFLQVYVTVLPNDYSNVKGVLKLWVRTPIVAMSYKWDDEALLDWKIGKRETLVLDPLSSMEISNRKAMDSKPLIPGTYTFHLELTTADGKFFAVEKAVNVIRKNRRGRN